MKISSVFTLSATITTVAWVEAAMADVERLLLTAIYGRSGR